jgi:RNA polymerase sigma-70 factor (ECF subfamily)
MTDEELGPASHERQLVERAQHGDSRALGLLYQRYVDRVYSFIEFRVRDSAVAEDLTQEVFVQVLRAMAGFDWHGSLGPWILRIARNAVVDHWRRLGRRPEGALAIEKPNPDNRAESPLERVPATAMAEELEAAEAALDREYLMAATAKLTDLQQQVIALRFSAGLTIRETAEAMERSEGAVKNLQHHALRALRRELTLRGELEAD